MFYVDDDGQEIKNCGFAENKMYFTGFEVLTAAAIKSIKLCSLLKFY
jgi:hypothetical protein